MSSTASDDQGLVDLANSTRHLIDQFLSALSHPAPLPNTIANLPNPLHVLRDAAKLLKAQTTKISLLLLNKPYTPSAVAKVLRDITTTCLPAMMSAVEICEPHIWGGLLHKEVQSRVAFVMREMQVCVQDILDIAAEARDGKKDAANGRDRLTSTGVVWQACDAVMELESLGLGGVAVEKAEEYRDTIKDALEELKEWSEDEEDDEDEDKDGTSSGDEDDAHSIEDLFTAANKMPKDKPELRAVLDDALDKLKKIGFLFTALIKRRLKTFNPTVAGIQANVKALDKLFVSLRRLPPRIDELASAFYDLDEVQARKILTTCIQDCRNAITCVKKNWNDGKEDEFSAWSDKWLDAVK